jgi:ribosome-associated protein
VTDSKPSKSERKRAQTALQELGEALLPLSDEQLDSLELDERLRDALSDAHRMKSHEARRRQKQYIGKLMRDVDPEPIQALLARLKADDRRQKRIFATAERWRDRLVNEGTAALGAFAAETGREDAALASLLEDYRRAVSDRDETTVRRNIFRRVHETLVACSTDG